MDKSNHFKYAEQLQEEKPEMDFYEFEHKMINKFEEEAYAMDIQEMYSTYFL